MVTNLNILLFISRAKTLRSRSPIQDVSTGDRQEIEISSRNRDENK